MTLSNGMFSSNDEKHAAGFILNKLYLWKKFGKRGNITHGGHTELANMQKGYPLDKRGAIRPSCQKMNGKLVLIFKSTGEDHICALYESDAIDVGLNICNYYRSTVGLPSLDNYFKEMRDIPKEVSEKKDYRKLTEKEKRTEKYRRGIEKWMKDNDL